MTMFKSLTNKLKNYKFNEAEKKRELINEIYILYKCNVRIIRDRVKERYNPALRILKTI